MKPGNGHSATRTREQKKALREAYKLLAANFAHVLIVCATVEEHQTEQGPDPDVCWSGGWLMADCLARFALRRTDHRHHFKSEPP